MGSSGKAIASSGTITPWKTKYVFSTPKLNMRVHYKGYAWV